MRYSIIITVICFLIAGCNKDKFTTAPQLTYESVNAKTFNRGDLIEFTLNFTDKEGDLVDSAALYIQKVSLKCPEDTLMKGDLQLPPFTVSGRAEGKIKLVYSYGNIGSYFQIIENPVTCSQNDSCYFRFMLRDRAQNKSDTVQSDVIVLIK